LAIEGRSQWGITRGAVSDFSGRTFARRCGVGVMDMLRFTALRLAGLGLPITARLTMRKISKLSIVIRRFHQLKPGVKYPATLVTTADTMMGRAGSQLQNSPPVASGARRQINPFSFELRREPGHGAGKPTAKQIEEAADELAFLTHALHFNVDAKP